MHKYIFCFILFHNKHTSTNIIRFRYIYEHCTFGNFTISRELGTSLYPGASQSHAYALSSHNRSILSWLFE